jgi:predicted transcriptional regulator
MRLTLFSEKNKAGLRQMEEHMVYTMDEIRERLRDRKLSVVADICNIPYPTLWRLMVGRQEAKQSALEALTNYIGGTHGNAQ